MIQLCKSKEAALFLRMNIRAPNFMKRTRKKISIKIKTARPRNLIAKALCSERRFQVRTFKDKKKELPKFDWRKAVVD